MRQQAVKQTQATSVPIVTDNQTRKNDGPVRAVLYVEVGEMGAAEVAALLAKIKHNYKGIENSDIYVVPIRGGSISSGMHFEREFLDVVRQVCEVRDGVIALKGGAVSVDVIRQYVGDE